MRAMMTPFKTSPGINFMQIVTGTQLLDQEGLAKKESEVNALKRK
jgi:hypothetical protein